MLEILRHLRHSICVYLSGVEDWESVGTLEGTPEKWRDGDGRARFALLILVYDEASGLSRAESDEPGVTYQEENAHSWLIYGPDSVCGEDGGFSCGSIYASGEV